MRGRARIPGVSSVRMARCVWGVDEVGSRYQGSRERRSERLIARYDAPECVTGPSQGRSLRGWGGNNRTMEHTLLWLSEFRRCGVMGGFGGLVVSVPAEKSIRAKHRIRIVRATSSKATRVRLGAGITLRYCSLRGTTSVRSRFEQARI